MFSEIISDLREIGWTETAIGSIVGANQSTINRLRRGIIPEPFWSLGDALIRLHKKEMRKAKRRAARISNN